MKIGVVFPQLEIGADVRVIREYVETAEELGYSHIMVYDHVLGADPKVWTGWRGPYTYEDMFHEVMVLLGYVAAVTRRVELVIGVLVAPQRQTALIAKQAAEVDVLSEGRLRLGVGVGWNKAEYLALGEDFQNRGKRIEEQVEVIRALWSQEVVTFEGTWHRIVGAGISPLPVRRPIPIWMGGSADVLLRRIARMADGWFPQFPPDDKGREKIERLRQYVREAGRDPSGVGIEGRLSIGQTPKERWTETIEAWRRLGASHLTVNTMRAGLESPRAHVEAIRRFREAMPSV